MRPESRALVRACTKMRKTFFVLIISVALVILLHTIAKEKLSAHVNKLVWQNFKNHFNDEQVIIDSSTNLLNGQNNSVNGFKEARVIVDNSTAVVQKGEEKFKYILQWTNPNNVPFVYMGVGRKGFIENKCLHTNCIVTSDQNYLGDYTKFDVIAFSGPEVVRMNNLPAKRSPKQKFVFGNIESSHYYPVCSNRFDGFFNWTWTFRLDSESRWGYIIVRNAQNKIIGPNKIMHWIKFEDMEPVSHEFKEGLKTKSKAAAWFVSNCYSKSGREVFVRELDTELAKYKLNVDIFGGCGKFSCPRDKQEECDELLRKDYYFYLSFENSFSEDYVTEKLLYGLKNNAIPIVYGGANYTRFMPEGIYLNARELGAEKLAKKMYDLINDLDTYAEYFRWKKYYSYYRRAESAETNDYCGFCKLLNNEEMLEKKSVIENFRDWWDNPKMC